MVTTGPVTPTQASIAHPQVGEGDLFWLEYIAIAPSVRLDCPDAARRAVRLKGIGPQLMLAAIKRSRALGCHGRIGLHAEGAQAQETYARWKMVELPEAPHPTGGAFPVFFGSADWAREFEERK